MIIEKILEQRPNVGDSSGKLSEEELREIAEFEVHLSSLRTFERKFEELQDEHARVMASIAEALVNYAGVGGNSIFSNESVVQRYEEAEKHMTSTIHQMFENAVNRLSQAPPVPSIKRKARKKKANSVAPPEPPKVSVKTAVHYVPIFVKGVPGMVGNNELQTVFNTKALVERFD